MKNFKTILATLLLLAGFTTVMTSCSDDKDEPQTPAAKSVAGTYTNNMTCSVNGSESVFENLTFKINATDDATVDVVIPSFGNPPMQLPEMTLSGIKVSGTDGTYTLAQTQINTTGANGKAITGNIKGSFMNNTLTLNFTLKYGAMPFDIICTFTAPRN